LGLASYLLTPIQRLGKYILILEKIKKELIKAKKPIEKVCAAIEVVRKVMRKGNDFIAMDSIKNSDIDLLMQGSFIMRAVFNVLKPRKFVSMVFLFENAIIFTEKISVSNNSLTEMGGSNEAKNVIPLKFLRKIRSKNVFPLVNSIRGHTVYLKQLYTLCPRIGFTRAKKIFFLRDCTLFGCLPRLFPRW
jgi:3-polyprenyl-4-hydroxybenzoate decarboxylase